MKSLSPEKNFAQDPSPEEPRAARSPQGCTPSTGVELIGCHGGAGTSTLASLLPVATDLGTFDQRTFDTLQVEGPLVLVARDTVSASLRITETVNVLDLLGRPIAGLVLMAEAPGRVPPHTRSRVRLLANSIPEVLRIPYVPQFRFLDLVSARRVNLPRKARAAMRKISELGAHSAHLPQPEPLDTER